MLLQQLRPTLRGPRQPPPEVTLRSMVLRMSRIHSAWAWEQHRNSNVRQRCLSRAHKVSVMFTNCQLLSPIWIQRIYFTLGSIFLSIHKSQTSGLTSHIVPHSPFPYTLGQSLC